MKYLSQVAVRYKVERKLDVLIIVIRKEQNLKFKFIPCIYLSILRELSEC